MAHMITNERDMAYIGETPWHGLGQRLSADTNLDKWRVAAGLNWEAEKRQAYYSKHIGGKNTPAAIQDRFALVRNDTQEDLGIVSDIYKIVQPTQVIEFYRDLVADNGFQMETAGSLDGGRRIWALAKMGQETRIFGQDKIGSYALLATSYDGKMSTIAKFTSVRVVCQNTLSYSLSDGSNQISIGHNCEFDAQAVKAKLGLAGESFAQFEENVIKLAETKFTPAAALEFIQAVIGSNAVKTDKKTGKIVASIQANKLINLAHNGIGQDMRSAKGTYWGLVNSVTEYYDRHAKGKQENRINSAWFGRGDAIKRKAFDTALQMAA